MALGSGKLFSGSNANRLRGDGDGQARRAITLVDSVTNNGNIIKFDLSTPYATGAVINYTMSGTDSTVFVGGNTGSTTIASDGNAIISFTINPTATSAFSNTTVSLACTTPQNVPIATSDSIELRLVNDVMISGGDEAVVDANVDFIFSADSADPWYGNTNLEKIKIHKWDSVGSYQLVPSTDPYSSSDTANVPIRAWIIGPGGSGRAPTPGNYGEYNANLAVGAVSWHTTSQLYMDYYNSTDVFAVNVGTGAKVNGTSATNTTFSYRDSLGQGTQAVAAFGATGFDQSGADFTFTSMPELDFIYGPEATRVSSGIYTGSPDASSAGYSGTARTWIYNNTRTGGAGVPPASPYPGWFQQQNTYSATSTNNGAASDQILITQEYKRRQLSYDADPDAGTGDVANISAVWPASFGNFDDLLKYRNNGSSPIMYGNTIMVPLTLVAGPAPLGQGNAALNAGQWNSRGSGGHGGYDSSTNYTTNTLAPTDGQNGIVWMFYPTNDSYIVAITT